MDNKGKDEELTPIQVNNITRGKTLVADGEVADTSWTRFRGLLGRSSLKSGEGLLILHSNSIHTLFMRFPIDVLYVDRDLNVIGIHDSLPPWRLGRFHLHSFLVLELPAGTLSKTGTQIGDRLQVDGYGR